MSKLVTVHIEFTIEVEDELLFTNNNAENDIDQVIDQYIIDNADILEYEIVCVHDFPEGE